MKVEETFYEHIEHVLVIMAKLSTPVLSIETNLETVVGLKSTGFAAPMSKEFGAKSTLRH